MKRSFLQRIDFARAPRSWRLAAAIVMVVVLSTGTAKFGLSAAFATTDRRDPMQSSVGSDCQSNLEKKGASMSDAGRRSHQASHELLQHRFGRTPTDDMIERLITSGDPLLRESLLIGMDAFCGGNLVLLHEELRKNHLLIIGATRCGKSALLSSLAAQRIRRNTGPLIVIDMRGDDEMMHTVRLETEAAGRPFWLYTNAFYLPTRIFNQLDQRHLAALSASQVGFFVAASTNLVHGQGYGKGHYTSQHLRGVTAAVVERANGGWMPTRRRARIKSFVDLPKRLREVEKENRELKDLHAAKTVAWQMAQIPQLNAVKGQKWFSDAAIEGAIQAWDLFIPNQDGRYPVLYESLRVDSDEFNAAITGKLTLNLIKSGIRQFTDFCKQGWIDAPPVQVDVLIDEASYILDRTLKNIIDQGASMGLRFIIATQDMSQLEAEDPKFAKTVFENCGNKILFTARSANWQEELMKLSGEKALHHISYTVDGWSLSGGNTGPQDSYDGLYSVRREPGPRFERNHLIEISDTPNRAIFIPAQSAGTTQYGGYPVVVDIPFLHRKEKYEYLQSLPWPARTEETIVAAEFQDEWEEFVAASCR